MQRFLSRAVLARSAAGLLGATLVLGACSSDDVTGPTTTPTASITVDASAATAFVALGAQPRLVTGPDTVSTTAWDIAFNATTVTLNAAGGVTAYCLCANASATDAAVMTFTAEGALPDFEAVTSASIPAESSFGADVFATQKWYRYDLAGNHQIWPTFEVYLVRRGSSVYKVQLIGYYDEAAHPRHITMRSALLGS